MKNDLYAGNNGHFKAFTLAELLITIAIIGVVAAMTIPTLLSNYQKQQVSVKLKRFYSMMSQAIKLSEVDNGPALYWKKPEMARDEEGNIDAVEQKELERAYWDKYFAPYIKVAKIEDYPDENVGQIMITLLDGSQTRFNNGDCIHFVYYVNGFNNSKGNGLSGFHFLLCDATKNSYFHARQPQKVFGCFNESLQMTREDALAKCTEAGEYCSCLLEFDNWELKDDFPYKF